MRFNALFPLLVLSCLCVAWAQGIYDDCCLSYDYHMTKHIQRHAKSYRLLRLDGGCNLPAVIFKLKKGKQFCADPDAKWVPELMAKLDKPKTHSYRRRHRKHWPDRT